MEELKTLLLDPKVVNLCIYLPLYLFLFLSFFLYFILRKLPPSLVSMCDFHYYLICLAFCFVWFQCCFVWLLLLTDLPDL